MTMLEQPVHARIDGSGRQTVVVTIHAGYRPESIIARAGLPIRVVFRREDGDICSERVVFSGPRVVHQLAPTGTTAIDLPAQPPGDIRFTCAMGRYRGRIAVVAEEGANAVSPLLGRLARQAVARRVALLFLALGVVAVVTVAVLVAVATAALMVVAAALLVWIVACPSTEPSASAASGAPCRAPRDR
jgi:hypothetical protein